MENHVAIINTPTIAPVNTAPLMHPAGSDWSVIDQETGNITLQTVVVNTVICPKTVKAQEYRHLIKGPDKLKWIKGMYNKIRIIFQ